MNNIINWLDQNKDWIFSGIGVLIIGGICGFIFKKKKDTKTINITQYGGKNSTNIQNNSIKGVEDE